jgi:hypothetical protein
MNLKSGRFSLAKPLFFFAAGAFPFLTMTPALMMAQVSDTVERVKDTRTDLQKIGGDVSAPTVVHSVAPKFPEASQRIQFQATALVNLYVEVDGKPTNVHAVRTTFFDSKGHVILGPASPELRQELQETATDAVKQYRFKPAMQNGKAVPVELNVEVHYKVY